MRIIDHNFNQWPKDQECCCTPAPLNSDKLVKFNNQTPDVTMHKKIQFSYKFCNIINIIQFNLF